MKNLSIRNFKKVAIAWVALCVTILASGCERSAGSIIDTLVTQTDDFQFLIIRTKIKWYDEYYVGYHCRSRLVTDDSRIGWPAVLDPDEYRGQGWRSFEGYTRTSTSLKTDDPIKNLKIYDNKTAYLDASLTVTFDACRTNTSFNVSRGASFRDAMAGKGIRYPDSSYNHGEPFLQNMKVHEGGGCFEINPFYVDEQKQYYYCSNDIGKTWTLETGRKQAAPSAPLPAADSKTSIKKPS